MGSGESGNYYTSGGSSVVHHQALIHSIDGEYTHNQKTGRPERLKAGGHGESSIQIMKANNIVVNILATYDNGVRVGNVPNHKNKRKRNGTAQTWFPKSWTTKDIVKAGEKVATMKTNLNKPDGVTLWGSYNGVRVGVIKTNGKVATIFPNEEQNYVKKKRRI